MRHEFQGYYRPTEGELEVLWRHCMFVLDANVLLNLYRYPQQARADFLSLLRQIQNRIWVPHQAALEYQENRLKVIAEQVKRYSEVRKVLGDARNRLRSDLDNLQLSKRHSSIDPERLLSKVGEIFDEFERELADLEKGQPDVYDKDQVRDELDCLLAGRIGGPPRDQAYLDQIYKEGKTRYAPKRPPGYEDLNEKGEDEIYTKGDLAFRRLYGDLILWSELIEAAKNDPRFKYIIFVTDDQKEDWWWIVDSRGKKTIGPRPELTNEIRAKAGVDGFYMYNPERFLEYAKTKLGAQVKEESIEQVRDIAALNRRQTSVASIRHFGLLAERAALHWLRSSHDNETVIENERGFPDFIVINEATGRKVGYEVKALREPLWAHRLVQDVQYRAFFEVSEGRLSEFFLILIGDSLPTAERMIPRLERLAQERPRGVRYIVATLSSETEEDDSPILNPLTVI
jgi:PIN like domain